MIFEALFALHASGIYMVREMTPWSFTLLFVIKVKPFLHRKFSTFVEFVDGTRLLETLQDWRTTSRNTRLRPQEDPMHLCPASTSILRPGLRMTGERGRETCQDDQMVDVVTEM